MQTLRQFTTRVIIVGFSVLVAADFLDNLFAGNRYEIPHEVYGLVGLVIGGVFASRIIGKSKDSLDV